MLKVKVVLIGSGGREHALGRALCQDPRTELYCLGPNRNPGLLDLCTTGRFHFLRGHLEQPVYLARFCRIVWGIHLAVIGPEAYLVAGFPEALRAEGITVIGPGGELAQLESSKLFLRKLLVKAGLEIYNPYFVELQPESYYGADWSITGKNQNDSAQVALAHDLGHFFPQGFVVKANGLRGGKGVRVYASVTEEQISSAIAYIEQLWSEDGVCLIEERLVGEEFSLMSFTDGKTLKHLPPIQDYKKLLEGDQGPNTGGMGCVLMEQLPFLSSEDVQTAEQVNKQVVFALQDGVDNRMWSNKIDRPSRSIMRSHSGQSESNLNWPHSANEFYQGIVYGSFMKTNESLKIIEYNARFGDPEVLLALEAIDWETSGYSLLQLFEKIVAGRLKELPELVRKTDYASLAMYLCPPGYPTNSRQGQHLDKILPKPLLKNLICASLSLEHDSKIEFQGTDLREREEGTTSAFKEHWLTGGSRLGALITSGQTLAEARRKMVALQHLLPSSLVYRSDIGEKLLASQKEISQKVKVTPLQPLTYEQAGVNLSEADRVVQLIQPAVQATHSQQVIANYGGFGGLYRSPNGSSGVLLSSIDGIGTKYRTVLQLAGNNLAAFRSLGRDLFNLNLNDLLVVGRGVQPLYFLDYFGCHQLVAEEVQALVEGISEECQRVGCALIGGETSEKPKTRVEDASGSDHQDYELVGTITGWLPDENLLFKKEAVQAGNLIIGLASSGPHTNGYSLINRLLADRRLDGDRWREELTTPHRNYYPIVTKLLNRFGEGIRGLCHITGGGFVENPPRVVPAGLECRFDWSAWPWPPVFREIQEAAGGLSDEEMLKTFNCGVGLIFIFSRKMAAEMMCFLSEQKESAWLIGEIVAQEE